MSNVLTKLAEATLREQIRKILREMPMQFGYGGRESVNDADGPGFKWNEYWITDPTYDETGRAKVDPVEYYGDAYLNSPFVGKNY